MKLHRMLKVNKSKTVLVLLTTVVQEHNLLSKYEFKKLTEDELITILGYKVDGREIQTLLHFTLEYKVSRIIWIEAYKHLATSNNNRPPQLWDEIFSIWCWYTQIKWEQKWIQEMILPDIIQMRLSNELKVLKVIQEGI
ncbi:46306_t:CDS:2 [Gigaspora margarita]|uniref:46306_t:CDS:1 n=1 Tax=Gigaspora margarita TaxID=4874 RepID=A0ABN7UH44_GIGMA|nr:46306_t:CDS:2 [Gigaspora margarita]